MSENIKLAWRNIWRNKRRTLITTASIFFGVILSALMTAMQEGTYTKMIENVVSFYSGYLQVQHPEYWENRTLDYMITPSDSLYESITANKITQAFPRIESFTLISSGEHTKGAALIGIDAAEEDRLTGLSRWVTKGNYLQPGQSGALVATNIAKNLEVTIGDTIVLLSQGYRGTTAAGLFPVVGILEFPAPQLNNLGVYVSLADAQEFFSTPGMVTSIVCMMNDYTDVHAGKKTLQRTLGDNYSVLTWDEMDPVTKQMIEGDRAQGVITKAILYVLIGFGVFGTVIMMIAERRKELGVLVAIGMKKRKLAMVLLYETVFIGLVGVAIGFVVSIPIVQYLVNNPIPITGEMAIAYEQFGMEPAIYFDNRPAVFLRQLLVILGISFTVAIYPVNKILRLKVTKALRG
jgi:putative ABC transport system permease protein